MLPFIHIGSKAFPMYGIFMALGILAACFLAGFRTNRCGKDVNSLIVIAACAIGIALVGAKLLYIIASHGIKNTINELFAGNFSILGGGGLVFYGGLIGGVLGAFLGKLIIKERLSDYCDAITPAIPLGHAFGRMGCFFAGCCHGMPYDGIFSVTFPAVGVTEPVFPSQLLEVAINLAICGYLIYYTRNYDRGFRSICRYGMLYAVSRFIMEFFRGDALRGISAGLSTSQWISIAIFIVCIAADQILRLRKPGTKAAA